MSPASHPDRRAIVTLATVRGDTCRASIDITKDLRFETTLFGETSETNGLEEDTFAPRVGLAWAPTEGQYLRAAFLRETPFNNLNTLAPIDIVGLRSDAVPDGTRLVETSILRWDSEWSDRFFTSVEYQHHDIKDLALSVPVYTFSTFIPNATFDRLSVTGNYWIGNGLSAFASYSHIWSKGDASQTEDQVPTVPENVARIGLNYISPKRIRFTVAETYLGQRPSFPDPADPFNYSKMDGVFLTDIAASWESEDRHLSATIAVSNLFDADAEVAPLAPGSLRTISATIRGRF